MISGGNFCFILVWCLVHNFTDYSVVWSQVCGETDTVMICLHYTWDCVDFSIFCLRYRWMLLILLILLCIILVSRYYLYWLCPGITGGMMTRCSIRISMFCTAQRLVSDSPLHPIYNTVNTHWLSWPCVTNSGSDWWRAGQLVWWLVDCCDVISECSRPRSGQS